jgi:hypothetical protein
MATDNRTGLRRFFDRLTASEQELEAEELQRDVVNSGARCRPATAGAARSSRCRTAAYRWRTLPARTCRRSRPTSTTAVTWSRWSSSGRRSIAGIEPGRQLTARGRIAIRDGRKVIYNPYYELEAPR